MNNGYLKHIRYVKIHFTVRFSNDTILQRNKASALRGGMGEMLLRINCIRDRQCENCDFESECLVRRIMYSKMEIQPKFMTAGDSIGYVIECEDYRTEFYEGDVLKFNVLLFGKTIVYFGQILDAFFRLGMHGIGKDHSQYSIIEVTNTLNEPILNGNDIFMDRYRVSTLEDYVKYRLRHILKKRTVEIQFKTPLSIKHRGEYIKEFDMEAIIAALKRRIFMLCCFEGIEVSQEEIYSGDLPQMNRQSHHMVQIPRYSNRKNEKMIIRGIEGNAEVERISEDLWPLLLAGELIHIGKNTSFGFGRFIVRRGS